ncbi:hypothetical protein [Paenibacillus xerothermodurans]|uniref:Uncharacterized protein n=1 Tax=Paenibacillus xerothermodurans TaxID=1977292 RepID=A0A2W1NAG4_PAEXE|nr:hypothetical protein [Paenibacillus xerothermodurans]PZE21649.1 hypothetical protein CBW46_004285 [Paenibacillus xerothermodurans]
MKAGDELVHDRDFEQAKKHGYPVKAVQDDMVVYPAGRVTAFSEHHVSIEGKRLLRSASHFVVAE